MVLKRYTSHRELVSDVGYAPFIDFLEKEGNDHFFQSPEFLQFIEPVDGYMPVLFIASDESGRVLGSLLGVYQRDGRMLKSWLSRRMIVWGGPLGGPTAANALLDALEKDATGKAIYIEFRNYFDTAAIRTVFDDHGFTFRPHLNFLLELGDMEAVRKRLSMNRRRQIKGSVTAGATYGEASSLREVEELYDLLASLYRDKVGKPLPSRELFLRMHNSPSGRIFVVRHEGRVIGGSAGPVYKNRTIYQWYVCGDDSVKGINASVLATWAQIEHGITKGFRSYDFMGAGRPGQGYGVYDFKARFGGEELSHGRYDKVLNRPLYELGARGLKVYHRMTQLMGKEKG